MTRTLLLIATLLLGAGLTGCVYHHHHHHDRWYGDGYYGRYERPHHWHGDWDRDRW